MRSLLLLPFVMVAASFIACRGELVAVGRADHPAGLIPSCEAPARLVSLKDGALGSGSLSGPEALTGNRLVFFRNDVTNQVYSLVVADVGGANERVLDSGANPSAVVATAASVFWVDSGAKLREADLTTGTPVTIDDARRLVQGESALAVSAQGTLAYASYDLVGGKTVSTLWRRRPGMPPEPVARVAGPISSIFLAPANTLLVSMDGASPARLFVTGPLDDLTAQPAPPNASGDGEPFVLSATSTEVAAFDGADVYSVARSRGLATVTAMSLASGATRILADGLRLASSGPTRVVLRGDELLWIEGDWETSLATDLPVTSVAKQAVRSVRTSGGPVRTVFSDDARVSGSLALTQVLVGGCRVAVVDASRRAKLVEP